jgi:hypothetical protein
VDEDNGAEKIEESSPSDGKTSRGFVAQSNTDEAATPIFFVLIIKEPFCVCWVESKSLVVRGYGC